MPEPTIEKLLSRIAELEKELEGTKKPVGVTKMSQDHALKPIDVAPYELRVDRPTDENLDELAHNFKYYKGHLVLLLGAGASIGALGGKPPQSPLPSANFLRNEIWREFMLSPDTPDFNFTQLSSMSLDQATAFAESKVGRKLVADFIASRFFYESTSLAARGAAISRSRRSVHHELRPTNRAGLESSRRTAWLQASGSNFRGRSAAFTRLGAAV